MSSETKYRFSVLIPAKGDCPYLDETLRSLLFSSIAPSEILIVDDGIEPIYLARITKMFPSLKIKIIKNLGLGLVDALNTGIENAKIAHQKFQHPNIAYHQSVTTVYELVELLIENSSFIDD